MQQCFLQRIGDCLICMQLYFFLTQKTKISSYIPVFETSHGLVSQLKVFVFNQDFF